MELVSKAKFKNLNPFTLCVYCISMAKGSGKQGKVLELNPAFLTGSMSHRDHIIHIESKNPRPGTRSLDMGLASAEGHSLKHVK
jgi:hypothetical protein